MGRVNNFLLSKQSYMWNKNILYKKMKYILIFALLYLSTSHAATDPNQKQNHQHTFLVKTDLTKEQVETLLKQY